LPNASRRASTAAQVSWSTARRESTLDRGADALGAQLASRRFMAKRWSGEVTRHSNALDLEPDVFKGSAAAVARSLKRSAMRSKRRKTTPYRSALAMLVFYINRAGKKLSPARKRTLERAKAELRKLFGRPARRVHHA